MKTQDIFFLTVVFLFSGDIFAQTDTLKSEISKEKIFFIVEEMPEFPGGEIALRKFIADNFKYPGNYKKISIKGKIIVKFEINQKGEICNAAVVNGITPLLNEEALRVVNSLPNFIAGKHKGKAVKVYYTIPFDLGFY